MTAHPRVRGDVAVLVPAAGMGVRLGPGAPKALRLLRGEPLLVHAVRRVAAAPSVGCIVVAAPSDAVDDVTALLGPLVASPVTTAPIVASETCGAAEPKLEASSESPLLPGSPLLLVVAGGASRQTSVAAALAAVPAEFGIVLVHDAARALTPPELVETVADAVRGGHGAVIPVLPVVDTIKEVDNSGIVVGTVDRSVLRAVQTPQGFRRDVLTSAHAAAVDEHTDDAGMAEKIGVPVHTVPGSEAAMKITRPFDLAIAELLF
ncbi:2-C-methyl-D-erythritol 4-phosphate cytidylyltransferase [Dactylosporangium sp. CA-152071]|uniref:2-C-methyl-D-erythritol 4-phosphate cytidylyltransferase n=1 Tax=Dactylosporangium sp. CA-152071 TaxID=3239933 RepID=UPI003D942F43